VNFYTTLLESFSSACIRENLDRNEVRRVYRYNQSNTSPSDRPSDERKLAKQQVLMKPKPIDQIQEGLRQQRVLPILTVALISGLVVITYQVSFGSLIFSGSLSPYLASGIGFCLMGVVPDRNDRSVAQRQSRNGGHPYSELSGDRGCDGQQYRWRDKRGL
jgi:hypothetical protein